MAGRLRKLFTEQELLCVFSNHNNVSAAQKLSASKEAVISPELVRYWRDTLKHKKSDGTRYKTSLPEDREIRESMILGKRRISSASHTEDNSSILVIPDLHAPYQHKDALAFLIAVAGKYNPTRIINVGDETDGHALSFHDSDPNLDSAGQELNSARIFLSKLAEYFPDIQFCDSNHGSLVYRRAFKTGIPVEYIKSYLEILFPKLAPNWSWSDQVELLLPDGSCAIFKHQVQGDIMHAAAHERSNMILGHKHANFSLEYRSNDYASYFGIQSGCLVDRASQAYAYGKNMINKPILGCAVIVDSHPILITMETDGDRWTGKLRG